LRCDPRHANLSALTCLPSRLAWLQVGLTYQSDKACWPAVMCNRWLV
jgi:hypothetical protein